MEHELNIGGVTSVKAPDDPTSYYLSFAFRTLQSIKNYPSEVRQLFERQDSVMICIASFLALESTINWLFYDIFICSNEYRRTLKSNIASTHVKYIKITGEDFQLKINSYYFHH